MSADPGSSSRTGSLGVLSGAVGRSVGELETPALVLDLPAAKRNIAAMAARFDALPSSLRPHIKAHKSPELAHLQIEAGAIGVTAATVAEAEAMVESGIDDVLVANEVVSPGWIRRVVRLCDRARVSVVVDDAANLAELSRVAASSGERLGVLVEVDVGMHRGGVRRPEEAMELVRAAVSSSGIAFRGLMGYEGHCADEPDPEVRARRAGSAMAELTAVADRIRGDGIEVESVSAGATGTFASTGAFPGVTEVQAGSYVLMDGFHRSLIEDFEFALTVQATAVSVHGETVVFDAGRKSIGADLQLPLPPDDGAELVFTHEEHVGFRYPHRAPYAVGDRVALVPGYAPTTVNLFGAVHVADSESVIDVWPVRARHGDL